MTNLEQAEAMLLMLINNGRKASDDKGFTFCHEDVMTMLELIKKTRGRWY